MNSDLLHDLYHQQKNGKHINTTHNLYPQVEVSSNLFQKHYPLHDINDDNHILFQTTRTTVPSSYQPQSNVIYYKTINRDDVHLNKNQAISNTTEEFHPVQDTTLIRPPPICPIQPTNIIDQDIPIVAIQKIQPLITHDPHETLIIKLKRYNPRLIPIDVKLQKPIEYILHSTEDGIDDESFQTKQSQVCCGVFSRGQSTPAPNDKKQFQLTGTTINARKIDFPIEQETLQQHSIDTGDTDQIKLYNGVDPIQNEHYNSWLLSLNYHLINKPDIMKTLPWKKELNGTISFLPSGTPLPGIVMSEDLGEIVGVPVPKECPKEVSLGYQEAIAALEKKEILYDHYQRVVHEVVSRTN